eukprot:4783096-Prymnesium_polylepis.3
MCIRDRLCFMCTLPLSKTRPFRSAGESEVARPVATSSAYCEHGQSSSSLAVLCRQFRGEKFRKLAHSEQCEANLLAHNG